MYLKRLLALLCSLALVFCLLPSTAFAEGGNGNIDGGGGSMGQGTSSNFWNPGNDGVRIAVVDADSGTAISSPPVWRGILLHQTSAVYAHHRQQQGAEQY